MKNRVLIDKVKNAVAIQLRIERSSIEMDTNILELGADSLDVVELLMCIEEDYNIEIPDNEAEALDTVNKIVAYLIKREVKY